MTATVNTSPVEIGTPYTDQEKNDITDFFVREGYVVMPGVFSENEVRELKIRLDRLREDPTLKDRDIAYSDFIFVRLFEVDTMFRDLLVKEPLIGLFEHLLGHDCHVIANNAVLNKPGQSISNWHIDFVEPWFPLPDGVERFDASLRYPTFVVNGQIMLSDMSDEAYGPTQVVPGSHYSGRPPNDPENPVFEGRGPLSIFCKPGDVYLQHPMVWHRGAPNTSDRQRYLLQHNMGQRFVAQKFYPFLNYRMPDSVLEGADERLLRVLGKHPKGAYG
ncbi:MAG: phytanoyl-CoA dioxygenase family protein [Verrucomicrobia bacterium]|nr:phytanoyl-CoA dioxygenase family protein [Verrucomicrobiota bacterium]